MLVSRLNPIAKNLATPRTSIGSSTFFKQKIFDGNISQTCVTAGVLFLRLSSLNNFARGLFPNNNLFQTSFFATKKAAEKPKPKPKLKPKLKSKPKLSVKPKSPVKSEKDKKEKKDESKGTEKEKVKSEKDEKGVIAKEKEKEKKQKERERTKEKKNKDKETKQKEKEKNKEKKEKLSEEKEKAKEQKRKEQEDKAAKPKKAKTPYTAYYLEQFGIIRKQQPNAKLPEIAKQIAQKWNSLSDTDKKPYVQRSEEDNKRFKKELEEYKKTLPPKRPSTAFMIFSNEKRAALAQAKPQAKITEIAKLLGIEWKKLSEAKKEAYKKSADKASAEWKQKMQNFKSD